MTITITGYSDDVIDIDGVVDCTGLGTNAGDGVFGEVRIGPTLEPCGDQPAGAAVVVEMHYTTSVGARAGGCWAAVIRRTEEGVPLLRATVEGMPHSRGGEYDVVVRVDAPAGTAVVYRKRGEVDRRQTGDVVQTVAGS